MKIFWFDLETTGTRFWKNGIHQISGLVDINGQIKEAVDIKVRPYKDAIIEDEALAVSHVTRDIIAGYKPFCEGYMDLVAVLGSYVNKFDKMDKFILAGYNNSPFDNQFLRAFFVQNGDNYFGSFFWSNCIDVMVLASAVLAGERTRLANFKLHTVAAYLGIQVDETRLHDGNYDINLTREIYLTISKKFNQTTWQA